MEIRKAIDDVKGYNSLVPTHNRLVTQLKSIAQAADFRATATQKLDLAFNRCLDTAILLSRFDRADLTTKAAEIDAEPEPSDQPDNATIRPSPDRPPNKMPHAAPKKRHG